MAKDSGERGTSILTLVLMFVAGFAVFSLVGFILLIILLSLGVLPVT